MIQTLNYIHRQDIPAFINTSSNDKRTYLNVKLKSEEYPGILSLSNDYLIYFPGSKQGLKRKISWKSIESVDKNSASSTKSKIRIKFRKPKNKKPLIMELPDRPEMELLHLDMQRRIAALRRELPDTLLTEVTEQASFAVNGEKDLEWCGEIDRSHESFTSHTAVMEGIMDNVYLSDESQNRRTIKIEVPGLENNDNHDEEMTKKESRLIEQLCSSVCTKWKNNNDPDCKRKFGWCLIALVVFLFLVTVVVAKFTY